MKNNNYGNYSVGVILDEIREAVSAYHIASMGDDRREIESAEATYLAMITLYGKETVQLVVDDYNKNVIGKAQKMITLTFETWEEFDEAIGAIASLEVALASE